MLKLVVSIIILAAVCCAQEHLTCLRTDDLLTQQSTQTSRRALQGSPGKRGPKGQVGSRGSPGQKGEPGIPDGHQIILLRNQINSLSQEIEALKEQSRKNQQFLDIFSKRLYVSPRFYIYQFITDRQSWQQSQNICQNWGGTLAVYGVKTLENRKKLIRNLSINSTYFWIGVNDIGSEGNWIWINGERANSSEIIWRRGEPNNSGNEDCVEVDGDLTRTTVGQANDGTCTNSRQALCEKVI